MTRLPEPRPPRVSVSVNARMVEAAMHELFIPGGSDIAGAFLVSHQGDIDTQLRIAANQVVTRLLRQEYRLQKGTVDVEDLIDAEDGI